MRQAVQYILWYKIGLGNPILPAYQCCSMNSACSYRRMKTDPVRIDRRTVQSNNMNFAEHEYYASVFPFRECLSLISGHSIAQDFYLVNYTCDINFRGISCFWNRFPHICGTKAEGCSQVVQGTFY